MIDTAKATDRRNLRFNSIDELLADIDRIVESDKKGTLRHIGNWTAGQIFGHIAGWIDYAYEGYPTKVPWFIRMFIRPKRTKYLREGLPAGVRIPRAEGGTYATQAYPTAEGADRLRKALRRLKSREPARYDSPAFGKLTDDERIALNLRHAELHLSFLHPSGPA